MSSFKTLQIISVALSKNFRTLNLPDRPMRTRLLKPLRPWVMLETLKIRMLPRLKLNS
jgi:hypothetical protein